MFEFVNYLSIIMNHSDYYPFGMLLPNRHESSNEYRYGFQGQEKDDEIKGEGNSVNYKYRMHDPRIGRFFAVDPLTSKYPHYTPYSFSGNSPIGSVEVGGLEGIPINGGISAGVSFNFGSHQNRFGVNVSGYVGAFNTVQVSGSLSAFYNFSNYGFSGSSSEIQATGGISVSFGKSFNINSGGTGGKDFTLGANNTGKRNSIFLYSSTYLDNNTTSQRVAGAGFTSGNFKFRFEDDYLPIFADAKTGILLGDAEDRYRSAAVKLDYKFSNFSASAGFTLWTGDPKEGWGNGSSNGLITKPIGFLSGSENAAYGIGKYGKYNMFTPGGNAVNGAGFSLGAAYGGITLGGNSFNLGYESEGIRQFIQNQATHNNVGSPWVPKVQGKEGKVFFQSGTINGTTLY